MQLTSVLVLSAAALVSADDSWSSTGGSWNSAEAAAWSTTRVVSTIIKSVAVSSVPCSTAASSSSSSSWSKASNTTTSKTTWHSWGKSAASSTGWITYTNATVPTVYPTLNPIKPTTSSSKTHATITPSGAFTGAANANSAGMGAAGVLAALGYALL